VVVACLPASAGGKVNYGQALFKCRRAKRVLGLELEHMCLPNNRAKLLGGWCFPNSGLANRFHG